MNVSSEGGAIAIDGDLLKWDCAEIADTSFHILYQHRGYRARVIAADYPNKVFVIKINGTPYRVVLKDRLDLAMEKMHKGSKISGGVNAIKAPMPGFILDLKVAVGDRVKAGDVILVLEAMKMENTLKSSYDGVVKDMKIKKGDSVEKGQVLVVF